MTKKKTKQITHIIPYDVWRNSQLSIARHYGGIKIGEVHYVLDYDNCKTEWVWEGMRYFPDLITYDKIPEKHLF